MKGKTFLDYVEQRLAPTLKRNDTVVMDNLPAHKAAGVREAIEGRGAALRYLPQYSPDLNPIEMPFSKLKAYLRKAAERNIPGLRRRIRIFARNLTLAPRLLTPPQTMIASNVASSGSVQCRSPRDGVRRLGVSAIGTWSEFLTHQNRQSTTLILARNS